jgi:hypothetical protein
MLEGECQFGILLLGTLHRLARSELTIIALLLSPMATGAYLSDRSRYGAGFNVRYS